MNKVIKKFNVLKRIVIILVTLLVLLGLFYFSRLINTNDTSLNNSNQSSTQIANPASINCIELGGELEIREDESGQYGICVMKGKECEEWALFRGECEL